MVLAQEASALSIRSMSEQTNGADQPACEAVMEEGRCSWQRRGAPVEPRNIPPRLKLPRRDPGDWAQPASDGTGQLAARQLRLLTGWPWRLG